MASNSSDQVVEQTLHISREVHVFKIPPRQDAGGYRSGEWRVADKIFSGRLRVMAIGDDLELRIEDPSSGELFAMCPVPSGRRGICVEPAIDSSRYFVLRLEDPNTKRHAFIGLGFDERGDAFDFTAALSDHERHVARANDSKAASSTSNPQQEISPEIAALYKSQGDLSLKDGQTIKVNISKGKKQAGGFLAGMEAQKLVPLSPPPGSHAAAPVLSPPPQPRAQAPSEQLPRPPQTISNPPSGNSGWATFD